MKAIARPDIVEAVRAKFFQLSFSPSDFARRSENAGEVLSSVHPSPIGNALNTFCCSRIPKLVPTNVAKKSLNLFSKDNLLIFS